MAMSSGAGQLRSVLAGDACVVAASVFDPLSARMAGALGQTVGVLGGSVASHVVLGAPDIILLTASELVDQCRRICRAEPSLALLVDADHGYGNALNVERTVEDLQQAGVAGVTIEDTLLPRAFGEGGPPLIDRREGVGKMLAALAGRGRGEAVVLGRTQAASSTSIDDAVDRLLAYQDAGVDALFVPGLRSMTDLDRLARAVERPLVLGGAAPALFKPDELAARGVRLWLWGHQPFTAAMATLFEAMRAARDGTLPADIAGAPMTRQLADLLRTEDYERRIRLWLSDSAEPHRD